MTSQSVTIVGLGYIGLPTAVIMANSGVNVTGVDTNAAHVDQINQGDAGFVEPGLGEGLRSALKSGNFRATTRVTHSDTYIIAVPTPFTDSYDIDMKYIYSAAESIAPSLKGGELIVLESTSPPLTTQRMAERILELRSDLAADGDTASGSKPVLYFAYCPERILPGNAMKELVANARIIGGETDEATRRAIEVYRSFCRGELLPTNAVTAELGKLTENSFRDVNIAFANELSLICEKLGVDIWELINLANKHPRVNILQPGPGVGGHCIAVDPWFIVSTDPEHSKLIRTAREVNDSKPKWVIGKVEEALKATGATKIAVLGLSFKANIDDLRQSPSLEITKELARKFPGVQVLAVEPNIRELPGELSSLDNVALKECDQAIKESDVIVLLVGHDEFRSVPAADIKGKTIFDTKGIWR